MRETERDKARIVFNAKLTVLVIPERQREAGGQGREVGGERERESEAIERRHFERKKKKKLGRFWRR